jgi:hypothetical protein
LTLTKEQLNSGKGAYDLIREEIEEMTSESGKKEDINFEATYYFKCTDRKMLDTLIALNTSVDTHRIAIELTPNETCKHNPDEKEAALLVATEAPNPLGATTRKMVAPSTRSKASVGNAADTKKRHLMDTVVLPKSTERLDAVEDSKPPALKSPTNDNSTEEGHIAKTAVSQVASNVEANSDGDSYCEIVEPFLPPQKRHKTTADNSFGITRVASRDPMRHKNRALQILIALARLTMNGMKEDPNDYITLVEKSNLKNVPNDLIALFANYPATNSGFAKMITPLRKSGHMTTGGKPGTLRITQKGYEHLKSQNIKIQPIQDNSEAQQLIQQKRYMGSNTVCGRIFDELVKNGGSMHKETLVKKKVSREEYENADAPGYKKALQQLKQTHEKGGKHPFKFQIIDYDFKVSPSVYLTDIAYPLGRPGNIVGKK